VIRVLTGLVIAVVAFMPTAAKSCHEHPQGHQVVDNTVQEH
jgi:hypothetical protein